MPGPGKPYTQGEMKAIVDYLVENNAYGQYKARRMWQDFASTGHVNRTWQSMKETFIKRILPDIHNPYYKLTAEQKRAFKDGKPLPVHSRLEIVRPATDDSSTTGDNHIDEEQASISKNTGEEVQSSKMNVRSKGSTDTIVLENCYETAEDIIRELESPCSPSKSLRDKITYSEPLTPMVQEVLDDFATDEDEPQLQIVEDEGDCNEDNRSVASSKHSKSSTTRIRKSVRMSLSRSRSDKPKRRSLSHSKSHSNKKENEFSKSKSASPTPKKIRSLKLKKTGKGWENQSTEDDEPNPTNTKEKDQTDNNVEKTAEISKESGTKTAGNISKINDITDTQIPNNQEHLGNKSAAGKRNSTESSTAKDENAEIEDSNEKKPRKRGRSASSTGQKRKIRKNNQDKDTDKANAQESQIPAIIVSGTQTYDSHPNICPNKTAQADETTFNSHGNQPKGDADITGKHTQSQNIVTESSKNNETNPNASTINPSLNHSNEDSYIPQQKNCEVQESAVKNTNARKVHDEDIREVQSENGLDTENKSCADKRAEFKSNKESPFTQDVLVLKSHSESETDREKKEIYHSRAEAVEKILGFSGGPSRKKTLGKTVKNRSRWNAERKSVSQMKGKSIILRSRSNDSSSGSESEDLPNRQFKPPDANDILSHEGALFVAGRSKVYPIVYAKKDRYHYVVQQGSDGSEEESISYWKNKFIEESKKLAEEKIRADELARLLSKAKRRESISSVPRASCSREHADADAIEITSDTSKNKEDSEKPVKFKFGQDLKPVEMECDHKNVASVLKQMEAFRQNNSNVQIKGVESPQMNGSVSVKFTESPQMNGNVQPKVPKLAQSEPEQPRTPTPTPELNEKIDKIEKEIFQEIADKAKIDDSNINKRKRGRPKKTASSTSISFRETISGPTSDGGKMPSPKPKIRKTISKETKSAEESASETGSSAKNTVDKDKEEFMTVKMSVDKEESLTKKLSVDKEESFIKKVSVDKEESLTKKMSRGKINNEAKATSSSVNGDTVFSKMSTRLPKKYGGAATEGIKSRQLLDSSRGIDIPERDPHVKYKFPNTHNTRSRSETRATNFKKQYFKSRMPPSNLSSESSQGYADSDLSPPPIKRKKRSISLPRVPRGRRRTFTDSHPYQADVENSQSQESPTKSAKNSTLNTSVYRSESFQHLMPRKLNQAQESSNDIKTQYYSLSPLSVNSDLGVADVDRKSSNSSLASPEISVVEKLSFSRELLNASAEHSSLNDIQIVEDLNMSGQPTERDMISDVEVNVPLEQDCEERISLKSAMSVSECLSSVVSASLLRNITIDSQEESLSDCLDLKLRNLLLESTKKLGQMQDDPKKSIMEVDEIVATIKKVRTKASSTPCKRLSKADTPLAGPILEEHVESCRKNGRRSCPPVINVIHCESPPRNEQPDVTLIDPKTMKRGRQKDLIKVKILKPRKSNSKNRSRSHSTSRLSITDSGINDTASDLYGSNNTMDLIHNHSETCLRTKECIGERSSDSETSRSGFSTIFIGRRRYTHDACVVPSVSNVEATELFSNDARDATGLDARSPTLGSPKADSSVPSMPSSLMTEDLSDESIPPTRLRYLLTDEETNPLPDVAPKAHNSVSNLNPSATASTSAIGAHSNLRQLFSAYAVPNLSIISEASREDSRKTISDINGNSNTY